MHHCATVNITHNGRNKNHTWTCIKTLDITSCSIKRSTPDQCVGFSRVVADCNPLALSHLKGETTVFNGLGWHPWCIHSIQNWWTEMVYCCILIEAWCTSLLTTRNHDEKHERPQSRIRPMAWDELERRVKEKQSTSAQHTRELP